MTQEQKILKYITDYGSISPLEAFRDLGIMRLSARIHDLESAGYIFEHCREKGKNRYGEDISYTRYYFATNRN